jgi:predicted RNA binding protein YcfA (HicA-like mRNA interferase family)
MVKKSTFEALESTKFTIPSVPELFLEWALENPQFELILPENEDMETQFSEITKDCRLVYELVWKYNKRLFIPIKDFYVQNLKSGYSMLECVQIQDEEIGLLWKHSDTIPNNISQSDRVKVDRTESDTKDLVQICIDVKSPPLSLRAEWAQIMEAYSETPADFTKEKKEAFKAEGKKQEEEILTRYRVSLPQSIWMLLDNTSVLQADQIKSLADKPEELALVVEHALVSQGHALAGDGMYQVRLLSDMISPAMGILVEYTPRASVPLFRECLTIAKERLPKAFKKPLIKGIYRPDKRRPQAFEVDRNLWENLDDLNFNNLGDDVLIDMGADIEAREKVRERLSEKGFEVFGWYQSFHRYEEDVWGIYLDDQAISCLAMDLTDRLSGISGFRAYHKALYILLFMVLEHERVHAQVDVSALMRELVSLKPCALLYKRKVYKKTEFTENWLEEAIANYQALQAVKKKLDDLVVLKKWTPDEGKIAIRFIIELFDHSPPGYADFRKGADYLNWRKLAAQIFEGRIDPGEPLSPVEGLLRDIPGIVFRNMDIPLYTTGQTALADVLAWTPSKSQVEKMLLQSGFKKIPKRGKGSHAWWRNANGHGFSVPGRDPLSLKVFNNLRKLLGVNKKEFQNRMASV